MDDFELELKKGFLEEAAQLLVDTEQCFLALENNPEDSGILEKIFRLAHNLKGSSKAVGFSDLGVFTHEFENLLLKLKSKELKVSQAVVTLLLKCNDHIRETIEKLQADVAVIVDHAVIQNEVQAAIQGKLSNDTNDTTQGSLSENLEEEIISADEIAIIQAAEERGAKIETPPPLAPHQLEQVEEKPAEVEVKQSKAVAPVENKNSVSEESIRVSLVRLEKLINFVGEMVILQTVLREQSYSNNISLLRKTVHQLGKVGKEIQDISMSLRMIPLKQTFHKMQRIVRDTSSALNKKVNLVLSGEETELDKTVLEAISDPLVHLIRNAVDHGIESTEERVQAGKAEAGTVFLSAYHQGGKLVLEIRDDGGGINPEKLIAKAREKGIIRKDQNLTRDQAINLIFHAGFSTKAVVTEVSGRGVGMDVVKTNIEGLQGDIRVETELGKGTVFYIFLPLTLAIIDAMVVALNQHRFVIPLAHIHESFRPGKGDIKRATGLGEILLLRGENLPLYRLSQLLKIRREERDASDCIALICRVSDNPFAILVDDILGQQQVVIKKLGQEMQNTKGFSGSAILGDGKPSLILELAELTKSDVNNFFRNENTRRASA